MPPTPTVYRPPQRPATAPAAKKNMGPLIGLIVAGVVAVVGLAVAAMMWSGKSAAQAQVGQMQQSAGALATALGVSLSADTNTPIDWTAAWAALDKAVNDQKQALATAKEQAAALEQQVAELQTSATELTELKPKAEQQASQLKKVSDELNALKASSAAQVASLEQELEGAKQALADAQAAAEAAAAQAAQAAQTPEPVADPAAAAETSPAGETAPTGMDPAPVETAAPVSNATAEAVPGSAEETVDAVATQTQPQDGSFVFPDKIRVLRQASYDAAGQILKVTLTDQTELVYRAVPYEIYEGLINSPVPEVYFRMKMVGNFPVAPDDKAALRDLRMR